MGQYMAHLSFFWNNSALIDSLARCRYEQGRLVARPSGFVHSLELDEDGAELYRLILDKALEPLSAETLRCVLSLRGSGSDNRFEATEFTDFLNWWNDPPESLDPVLRAGVAFFWYLNMVRLYDLPTGFKRICLLPELSLQGFERTARRHYDLFQGLVAQREDLLQHLSTSSNGPDSSPMDLTNWLLHFLKIYKQTLAEAGAIAEPVSPQDLFWVRHRHAQISLRQKKALEHVLKSGEELTNRLYVRLTKVSRETAKRDLSQLVRQSVIERNTASQGRSVSYTVLAQ